MAGSERCSRHHSIDVALVVTQLSVLGNLADSLAPKIPTSHPYKKLRDSSIPISLQPRHPCAPSRTIARTCTARRLLQRVPVWIGLGRASRDVTMMRSSGSISSLSGKRSLRRALSRILYTQKQSMPGPKAAPGLPRRLTGFTPHFMSAQQ